MRNYPDDHYSYGYDSQYDFLEDLRRLSANWSGKVGECVGTRHEFRLIRFRNEYGLAEDVWVPKFLLCTSPAPRTRIAEESEVHEMDDLLSPGW